MEFSFYLPFSGAAKKFRKGFPGRGMTSKNQNSALNVVLLFSYETNWIVPYFSDEVDEFPVNFVHFSGYLEMSVFDGFFFHHKAYDTRHRIDQNEIADIEFCADKKAFDLYVRFSLLIVPESFFTHTIDFPVFLRN